MLRWQLKQSHSGRFLYQNGICFLPPFRTTNVFWNLQFPSLQCYQWFSTSWLSQIQIQNLWDIGPDDRHLYWTITVRASPRAMNSSINVLDSFTLYSNLYATNDYPFWASDNSNKLPSLFTLFLPKIILTSNFWVPSYSYTLSVSSLSVNVVIFLINKPSICYFDCLYVCFGISLFVIIIWFLELMLYCCTFRMLISGGSSLHGRSRRV